MGQMRFHLKSSLVARLKAQNDENRRVKKMFVEERLMAEIVQEVLKKSGKAIPASRDGQESS